ncbi:unnamed protein product, partial [Meganyctiphanes norvegica]
YIFFFLQGIIFLEMADENFESSQLPETREVLCENLHIKVRYLNPALADQITGILVAEKNIKDILQLLTTDSLLEEQVEQAVASLSESDTELKESLGTVLYQAVSVYEQELCAQVTGMLLELPVAVVSKLITSDKELQLAVDKAKNEYLSFIKVNGNSESNLMPIGNFTLSREKEEIGEVIYEKLSIDHTTEETSKLTGMLLQMEYQDLVKVIANPELLKMKASQALSALKIQT